MRNVDLIFRVYLIEPRIKRHDTELPVELTLMSLSDGHIENKNEFDTQDEAVYFLQVSTNVSPSREYMIIPSCKVR